MRRLWYNNAMAFFFRRRTHTYIVLDVGSHSIKTAIFEKSDTEMSPRNVKKIVTRLGGASRGEGAAKSLEEVLASLLKQTGAKPEKVIVGIGSNMADMSLEQWTLDPLHFREALAPAHIQKYFEEMFAKRREGTRAFLSYPFAIDANGYPADASMLARQPLSSLKEITLHAMTLAFSDEAGYALANLKNIFEGIAINYVPLQAACAQTMVDACGIRDALLIDVGGSSTMVTFVQGGRMRQLAGFAIGADRFNHRIIKMRGGKFVEAEDIIRQYAHGLMSKREQEDISHLFSEETTIWRKAFAEGLESCYAIAPLAKDFYLYGGGSYLPEIRAGVWAKDILKNASPFDSPDVHMMRGSQIFNNDSLGGLIDGPEDVGLASLIHYSLWHKPLF